MSAKVFITGGATGLGKLLGEMFLKEGAEVGVCGIQDASEIQDLPVGFHYFRADVTNENELKKAVDDFVSKVGRLDVMIANAGVNMPKTTVPDLQKGKLVTMVNVLGVVHAFGSALPYFLTQSSGHFVAISSLSGLNGLPGMSYYGASKAFVSTFCESLSVDLPLKGIYTTCVHPGFVSTEFTKNNTHPMPFLLTPQEAADEIFKTIKSKKPTHYFPKVPALFMGTLRRLPRFAYQLIMKKDLLKLRHD